jgi:MFS family permease
MRMMRIPAVWTTNLVSLLFGVGMYAGFAFLPQFLQTPERAGYGFGATVTASGLMLLPQSLATFAAGLLSGRLAARFGSKRLLVIDAALSQLGLALVPGELWQVLIASTVGGSAFGLAFAAMPNLVVEAVPRSQTGVASGMNANTRTVGGAIGGAVLGSVVTAGARADGLPIEAGYTHGFAVLASCSAIAALAALLVPVLRQPEREEFEGEVRHAELAVVAGGTLVSDSSR